ncbi:MAG: hypothetical protein KC609_05440 [Myxococcales bacterium]|nr:hypothetical protein [Myxococcales bacterium]
MRAICIAAALLFAFGVGGFGCGKSSSTADGVTSNGDGSNGDDGTQTTDGSQTDDGAQIGDDSTIGDGTEPLDTEVPDVKPVSCGNNTREGVERCDGTDLDGRKCETEGFPNGGTLSCADNCLGFDTSGCTAGCRAPDEACVTSKDCCDGSCIDNRCVQQKSTCGEPGASCNVAADCCNLACVSGTCAFDGGCAPIGQPCASDGQCCSNTCGTDGMCQKATTGCFPRGEVCSGNGQCCSEYCDPTTNKCQGSSFCRSKGELCTASDQCCGNDCRELDDTTPCGPNSTTCHCFKSLSPFACVPIGEACNQSACCSVACIADGTGFKSCQSLGGCRPAGEICRSDGECCNINAPRKPGDKLAGENCGTDGECWSGHCAAGQCTGICDFTTTNTPGIGRCRNPTGAAPGGEICQAPPNHSCVGGDDKCVISVFGIKRCEGAGTTPGGETCALDGQSCEADGDCCCRQPDGSPCAGVCSNSTCGCTPDGGVCSQGTDCCNGVCTLDATSGKLLCSTCRQQGQSCSTHLDCCGGNCNAQTGTCGANVECVPFGASCTTSASCCTGLVCNGTCIAGEHL